MKHRTVALFIPHAGCPHRCSFCDQRSITRRPHVPTPDEVTQSLAEAFQTPHPMDKTTEIALFGGSFTALPLPLMEEYLRRAAYFVQKCGLRGIRVSTRPDAIDRPRLDLLKRYGVTTIELGVQSMDDRVLAQNRRGHNARDTVQAAQAIREAGFALGLQMMAGLPGDTPEGAVETARQLAALKPQGVRLYPVLVLPDTELAERYLAGDYQPLSLEQGVELCAELLWFFHQQGIAVWKCGLHASDGLQRQCLAGPYHPAFRELCDNVLYLRLAREALAAKNKTDAPILLQVAKGECSKLVGQKRNNLRLLEAQTGCRLRVAEDETLTPYTLRVIQQ